MAFWHAQGLVIYRLAEGYMRGKLEEYGYQEVETPQILDRSLWERSGHWDKFTRGHVHVPTWTITTSPSSP